MGGPKDTIPPVLVTSSPANNEKNFKGKTVVLNFDEAVKIKDLKEIIITPSPGKDVNILAKNKQVTIEPKLGWLDTTTYSISFREGIQDITESTPAKNLHLAFSTGPIIDSLTVSGNVHLALKETIPDKITVALYQADTFSIFKHQPVYFTETEKKTGAFRIANLKAGDYKIYCFEDKNKNLKVDSQTELYGFISTPLSINTNLSKVQLYMVAVDSRKLKVNSLRHNIKQTYVRLSKPARRYSIEAQDTEKPITTFGDNTSEILIYHTSELKDSVKIRLIANDSLDQKLDTAIYVKASTGRALKEKFRLTLSDPSIDALSSTFTASLAFTLPIKRIATDSMFVQFDSTTVVAITEANVIQDTITKTGKLSLTLKKDLLANAESRPTLYMAKGSFISIEDDSSAVIRAPIPLIKGEDTGQLSLDIQTKEPYFVIELINREGKVVRSSANTKSITFSGLPATEYKIRALIDKNNNGVWDVGNVYRKKEPEHYVYLRNTDKKYEQNIRANWEVGPLTFRF